MICDGFKSFRNKTIIKFDKGFTAIVGANGSGKSNIIDAFVFVLGELSAKSLRANNIKDLISNGGNGQGPAQKAKVEIYFDNSDNAFALEKSEIRISREIDRDGNGVYKLNGKRSTRKAIMNHLDLAGLLPNSSNMIMQGELFRLINMNDTERRELVEQIAGIASYNERKESAEDELANVQANLGQINLLLNEVRGQLDQLRKEKEDAERFLDIQEQEKIRKNALLLVRQLDAQEEISQFDLKKKQTEIELDKINQLETKTKQEIAKLEAEIEVLKPRISALQDKELMQMTYRLKELKDKLTELKTSLKYAQQNLSQYQQEQQKLHKKIQDLSDQETVLKQEIEIIEAEKKEQQKKIEETKENIHDLEDQMVSIDAHYSQLKEKLRTLQEKKNSLKELRTEQNTSLKIKEQKILGLKENKENLEKKIFVNHEKIGDLKVKIEELKQKKRERLGLQEMDEVSKENIEEKIQKYDQEVETYQKRLKNLKPKSLELQKQIFKLRSEIQMHKEIHSESRAISALKKLRNQQKIKGIYGTIAELGSADKKFATALEMGVGGRFNYVVVDNQLTGEKCINYLKQNRLGRASFIPLDNIKYKPFHAQIPQAPDVYGRAIDLISFDQKFYHAFEYVFGRLIIVENIPTARRLQVPARRVTLDGDIVDGSNLMTGGQKRRSTGLGFKGSNDSRQKLTKLENEFQHHEQEIQFLESKIKEYQNEISRLYKLKISGANRTKELSEQIAISKSQIQQLNDMIKNTEEEISQILQKLEDLKAEKQGIINKIDDFDQKLNIVNKEIHDLQKQLENSEESQIKSNIKNLEDKLKKLERYFNDLEIKLTKKQTTLNETLFSSKKDTENLLSEKSVAITETTSAITKFQKELAEVQEESSVLEEKITQKNAAVAKLMQRKKQLLLEISDKKTEIGQLSEKVYPLKLKINQFQMKTEELDTKIKEWECQINPDIEVAEEFLQVSAEIHEKNLSSLENEREKIGAVNLRAIQKYKDIEERYSDLEEKNDQVVREREAILEFIETLEKEKKRVFMNTFNAINQNFGYIFSKLSPGGEAKLKLLNPDDPFEDGVEIIARPGEKEKCNVMALSGGERTLTIIALILGIQMHVPSPYYVLDEIDAALDDVNAALVADMIKELAEKSQFIIITHRDVTMARVDQLLGVSNIEGVTLVVNLSIQSVLQKLKSGEQAMDAAT